MEKMQNHTIVQVGVIVKDIEKTARKYAEVFGLPVPSVSLTDEADKTQIEYRGQTTSARAKLAFMDMGNVQLELIEPNEHPSTWREFLDKNGEGIHHIAFMTKGMKETVAYLAANGMPLVQKGEYTGGRYAYIDSTNELGLILELLEND